MAPATSSRFFFASSERTATTKVSPRSSVAVAPASTALTLRATGKPAARLYARSRGTLQVVETQLTVEEYGYAIRKDEPELEANSEFMRAYFEKKYGYKPPKPYQELIARPRRDNMPKRMAERMTSKNKSVYYDDEF